MLNVIHKQMVVTKNLYLPGTKRVEVFAVRVGGIVVMLVFVSGYRNRNNSIEAIL